MGFPQSIKVGELYQGLTNQAPWRHFPGQVKDILNMSLDISIGSRTRSGTRLVGELGSALDFTYTVDDMRFYHFRGALIIVGSDPGTGDGFIQAFDSETLTELVVTGDFTYIDDTWKDTIRFTAIRDAILVMNREVVPQALASGNYTVEGTVSTADDLPITANLDDQYYVESSSGSTPRGFYQADVATPTTQDWTRISAPLQDDAVLQGASMPHQLLEQFDDDFDFTIVLLGPFTVGETITGDVTGATGVVRSVGPGDRLTAELTSANEFTTADSITGSGSGTVATVDAYYPSSVRSFTFSEVTWEERSSGTPSSNPSAIWAQTNTNEGAPLDAIEFHSGRLFLIGANAVTFSDARNRVNFFLDDVTDEIPLFTAYGSVDINAPTIGSIEWAISATNNLMIIGENGQITFTSGQEQLSSLNGVVEPVENFNNSRAIPTSTGGRVTIVDEYGDVRDFSFDPVSLFMRYEGNRASHALKILQQVETYQIFAFDDFSYFVGDEDTRLHQFTVTPAGQTAQNGWSKLRFPGDVVYMWQWLDRIYILERDADRITYVVLDYIQRQEPLPVGYCFAPAMDFMQEISATVYDANDDETEFMYPDAGLATRGVKADTLTPCRDEWWDDPTPVISDLVEELNAAVDTPLPYDLDENQVVDPFDDSANQNIIDSKGTYDAGGDFYEPTKTYSSNLFTTGTNITVSSGIGGANVTDGNTSTFWQALAIGSDPNPWVHYDFGSAFDANDVIRYSVGASGTGDIVEWLFQGSNDGLNWDTLDTQTAQSFANFEIKTYDIANVVNYRLYRLYDVLDSVGDGAQVSEFRAYELESNDIDIESDVLPATITPSGCIISVMHDGTIALDTELTAYVSRNGGTDFYEIPLTFYEQRLDGRTVVVGAYDFVDTNYGTDVQWKVVVTGDQNLNDVTLDGVALQWFDLRDGEGNQVVTPTRILSDRFYVSGDVRGEYIVGEIYDWFMLLTELYVEATNRTPIVNKLSFFYVNSFEFDMGIKRTAVLEEPYTRTFATTNVGSTTVDNNSIKTGMGMFPIGLDGRGADIVFSGTGPVPTTLSALEYTVRIKGKNLGYGGQSESF